MSGLRTAYVELPSEGGMAAAARNAVRAFLESASAGTALTDRDLDEISVVVQEACTNAVRHAHAHDAAKRFRVEVALGDAEVEIRVIDRGAPFDLSAARPLDPEQLREGGYGIHIMRTWMDDVSVRHDGTGNVLCLRRRLGARAIPGEGDLVRG